ncbi:EAL domain-containing protein [Liquorilactobacillus mali]|uniref:EAL domain-containing protein n=1 Tax=Liquorilactobacillus mali TaxID=1618 RepID=UPI00235070AE|nr:EAL domain-containing protein [Liquorilactobacillus mali]MDC7952433.1 EAL domain-containing protein [Liquorilactobacillus mali]MDV7757435.1 EAL domain-containing protein [Liquorilactobacillus mali]
MYRFYVQPQQNVYTRSLIGYEMLFRKYDCNGWHLPQDFASIPFEEQINLLKKVGTDLKLKVESLSFNLNREQFTSQTMTNILIETQKQIYPATLIVELTEDQGNQNIRTEEIKQYAKQYLKYGIELSIDDVSSGDNIYEKIAPLLDITSEIKFPMQNLRSEHRESEIPGQLLFWRKIARNFGLRLIVEGIESAGDDELLNELDLPLRQGYFYEKPHLFRLIGDPKL